jgi:CubicO group peptidase (beta-lactamase class C family)
MRILITSLLIVFSLNALCAQSFPVQRPEKLGFAADLSLKLDNCINAAIENGDTPGAVLLVMRNGQIAHRQAYGFAMVEPEKKLMTIETVFDLASITKPIATATAIMILVERGQIRLMDRVSRYIPSFRGWTSAEGKKTSIRLWHLLTHTSGLPPYAPVNELVEQYGSPNADSTIAYIATVNRRAEPTTQFVYSCLNFITLQRIVEIVSGESLAEFTRENIFDPLRMTLTTFRPAGQLCAATEVLNGTALQGVVHDPLARVMMGGVSGNAGLFSTADDISRFAQMMLNGGDLDGQRILSPLTVKTLTTVPEPVRFSGRALGWDVDSDYSSNGGDLFPYGSYGHTGYTGTSLWIDPLTKTAVIFLTNRVHPADSTSVVRLRSMVANIVAASILDLDITKHDR